MTSSTNLFEARGVTKRFGTNTVLNNIDFRVDAGSAHVLMGENGAGKSTLIKILCGIHQPDTGTLFMRGQRVTLPSPRFAAQIGIRVVHQEFSLVPWLSVAENIHLGAPPTRAGGWIDRPSMRASARRILSDLGVDIDPEMTIDELTVAQRQLVEIARALAGQAQVLILDEPTAALSINEVERLIASVVRLKEQGIGIVYISHRMEEVRRIGDRVSVLRDGQLVKQADIRQIENADLIEAMIGRSLDQQYPARKNAIGAVVLETQALSSAGAFDGVSLQLHAGEVLGVVGPIGCGFIELGHALYGLRKTTAGEIRVKGRKVKLSDPRRAMASGLGFVPEDRKQSGLMLKSTVRMNASSAILRRLTRFGRPIARAQERAAVAAMLDKLKVASPGQNAPIGLLSGGNQQKIVFGRWLLHGADVLVLGEPTRGVDVGAKEMIYTQINELAAQGTCVLLLTSDLMEAIGVCDRLLIMRRGRIVTELASQALTMSNVLSALYAEEAYYHAS